MRSIRSFVLAALVLSAAAIPTLAQSQTYTIRLPFQQNAALAVGTTVGGIEVRDLEIRRADKTPFNRVRGGESRYSWFEYDLRVQPNEGARTFRVVYRLYDANDAIIDEFEVDERVWRKKAQVISDRRITLNYIVPLVREVEVTVTAE